MNFINWWKVNDYDQTLKAFGFEYTTKAGDDSDGTLLYKLSLDHYTDIRLEIQYSTWPDNKKDYLFEILLYSLNLSTNIRDINIARGNLFNFSDSNFDVCFEKFKEYLLKED